MRRKGRKSEGGTEGAIKAAISILAYRENTRKTLYEKLISRGFSEEEATEAVEFAVEKNYLSERRHFIRFVEFYAKNKLFGKRRILQEARRKGFSEETVRTYAAEAFAQVDFDEACYVALCRCKCDVKEKTVATLVRRGYSMSNVRYAFDHYEETHGRPHEKPRDGDGNEERTDFIE